ncbi:hypothetical protein QE152_g9857 [Popillia japonica]|uniref:Uncharacterized protein n=1 Tax=Popillia japonica TaxID=7064 RepID=A0AAW1LYS9_POPJA
MSHELVSGRPRKIIGNNVNALVPLGGENPPLGVQQLAKRLGNQRQKSKLVTKKTEKIPAMTPLQRQQRIDFCQRFQDDNFKGFGFETAHALYPEGWRFQQNNARSNTSAYTTAWMQEQNLATIPWHGD